MNAEQWTEALGEIDLSLVNEALLPAPRVNNRLAGRWLRFAAAAAVFLLVAGGVWFALRRLPGKTASEPPYLNTAETGQTSAAAETSVSAGTADGTNAVSTAQNGAETEPSATAAAPETSAVVPATAAPETQPITAVQSTKAEPAAQPTKAEPAAQPTKAEPDAGPTKAGPAATNAASDPASTTAAATHTPETAAPTIADPSAPTAEPSWWERLFGGAGFSSVLGNNDAGLLQRIAGLFSGGTPSGAGAENDEDETADPRGTAPADAFDKYLEAENARALRMQTQRLTEKTQAELEDLYGGPFLPTYFIGRSSSPSEVSGNAHGVREPSDGTAPAACNAYLYVWSSAGGGTYSFAVLADNGASPLPEGLAAVAEVYRAGAVTVYWRSRTADGETVRIALAQRGGSVFTYALTGDCGGEEFLRMVTSALGC